jgi:hypothetical protein
MQPRWLMAAGSDEAADVASTAVDAAIVIVVLGIDEIANPTLAEGSVVAAIAINIAVAILANLPIIVVEVLGLDWLAECKEGE